MITKIVIQSKIQMKYTNIIESTNKKTNNRHDKIIEYKDVYDLRLQIPAEKVSTYGDLA